jgi:hypothetical protein
LPQIPGNSEDLATADQELFRERRVQDHLERTEVRERGFDHGAAMCAIGGVSGA